MCNALNFHLVDLVEDISFGIALPRAQSSRQVLWPMLPVRTRAKWSASWQ